jgi:hypothetical protein
MAIQFNFGLVAKGLTLRVSHATCSYNQVRLELPVGAGVRTAFGASHFGLLMGMQMTMLLSRNGGLLRKVSCTS